jgi:hypothetical protein
MHENTLCQFCKINVCLNGMCSPCHALYWEFEKFLSAEQNNELQIALFKKQPLPTWLEPWWAKMKKMVVFL